MAESTPLAPLVEADELLRLAGAPRLRIMDCRHELLRPQWGDAAYAGGHIPGALFASVDRDLSAPIRPGTGRHPLPSPADFAATLGHWGIDADTRVVAYDHGPGAWAARLWWMLRAVGHDAVQVLNGGLPAWLAAGGTVNTAVPRIVPAQVPVREFAGVATTAEVEAQLAADGITLVDARSADRFAGQNETVDPVAGHVPGAVNHPFTSNLDAAQRFLPPAELARRWQKELQLAAARPLVAMCGSGVTACHNLLALQLAGHVGARLYAGSYSEWIADPGRPVAAGA
ncbi:MAG TPA: sulfurtransferase [Steroidobacteraceae bacterium]|nr:sulfurtransferase [Steroidobacteraceae bacterium]